MLPDPLHPAVVHFPIVLAMLAPLVAVAALWVIRGGVAPRKAWSVAVAVLAALALSGWVATQTGEQEEDRVERVVAEQALESHEEAAEFFLYASVAVFLVAATGLAGGRLGRLGRVVGTAGSIALIGAGWNVGHSGGSLVYEHGAASAYVDRSPTASTEIARELRRGQGRDDGDERGN